MKKNLAIVLALVFVLSISGAAFAAPNPFVDVPAKHWAYDSINTLVKNKVIDGFGDGTYRGDKTLTRYEVAVIVAKALAKSDKVNAESKAAIDKLQVEFAAELQNLGVRVEKLEKNASSIKITGDARIRYQRAQNGSIADTAANPNANSRFQERIRLNLTADVSDNIKFYGRVVADSNNSNVNGTGGAARTSSSAAMRYDRAEFAYTNGAFGFSAGRLLPTLGQGILWDGNAADGAIASYKFDKVTVAAGVLDVYPTFNTNAGVAGGSMDVSVANVSAKVGDNVNVSLAYLKNISAGYPFKQLAYGANAKLGPDFTVIAEGVKNSNSDLPTNAQKTGYWARLQYKALDTKTVGSYRIYVDYMKLGNYAVDSATYGHTLNVSGGNGIGGDGAKGWGLGVGYVFAKNADFEARYYNLKPYDTAFSGFDKYKATYTVTTNFRF